MRCLEFHERSELLVMLALYLLGHGASFWSCKALCNISTSEVCKFFHCFLDAMVDMKDKFIPLMADMDSLLQVSKDYKAVGLPRCVAPWMWSM